MTLIQPLGEAAWTVTLGDRVDRDLNARVRRLAGAIARAEVPGVTEVVPAYASLTVFFDPVNADAEAIHRALTDFTDAEPGGGQELPPPDAATAAPPIVIPVRYYGPDLDEVGDRTGLARDEVVRRHCAPEYQVYLLGFSPGFAYLGDLDPALVLPRRSAPRTRVPAGSVAIAGAQTAVYPLATPGGWHLIGRTSAVMFDPAREPPALLRPGDRVRFEPV